jgi:hypothetical protein
VATRQNATCKLPLKLLNQITARAELANRSRNDEMRHLIAAGLAFIGDREYIVELPNGPTTRKVVWLDFDLLRDATQRAKRFHRPLSTELTLLMAYAIQQITERDLAVIRSMMSHEDRAAP